MVPKGAMDSQENSLDSIRPNFKTPVRGLYLAGSSTYPGPGVELSLMWATYCAHDINGWKH
jgi:all-trans-retinol 13,14-reductase